MVRERGGPPVGDGARAGEVGAYVVVLDADLYGARGQADAAAGVARDEVAGGRGRSPDRRERVAGRFDEDPVASVGQGAAAGGVGANIIPGDEDAGL